jgi:hypothetical protein
MMKKRVTVIDDNDCFPYELDINYDHKKSDEMILRISMNFFMSSNINFIE